MAYRSTRPSLAFAAAALTVACALMPAACASPAPEPEPVEPVRALDVAVGRQTEPVDLEVDGGDQGVQITYRRVTMKPGAVSGPHCHHGQLVVVVEKGEITHLSDTYPGGVRVYGVGESIIEDAYVIHEAVNLGEETAEMMITHLTPEGKPLTETDLAQCE